MRNLSSVPVLLLALLACAANVAAQTAPCAAMNDQNNTVSSAITATALAGPTTWAWQFTPATPLLARSVRIYTGNTRRPTGMVLEIWSDDAATQLPLARLAGGTLRYPPTTTPEWLGTNLDEMVLLLPNTAYWIAWTEGGSSQVPTEPGGVALPAARSINNGPWAALAPAALKFRIFCALLDDQGLATAGPACGQGTTVGTAFATLPPRIGTGDFAVEGTGFPSGAAALLLVGVQRTFQGFPIPGGIPGCHLNTDVLMVLAGTTGTGNVRSTTGLARHVAFPLPIPGDPSLIGGFVAFQVLVHDASAAVAVPFLASNALHATVF